MEGESVGGRKNVQVGHDLIRRRQQQVPAKPVPGRPELARPDEQDVRALVRRLGELHCLTGDGVGRVDEVAVLVVDDCAGLDAVGSSEARREDARKPRQVSPPSHVSVKTTKAQEPADAPRR